MAQGKCSASADSKGFFTIKICCVDGTLGVSVIGTTNRIHYVCWLNLLYFSEQAITFNTRLI